MSSAATIASDAVDLGDGGGAGRDRYLDPRFGGGELSIEFADVAEQLLGQRLAFGLDLAGGSDGP